MWLLQINMYCQVRFSHFFIKLNLMIFNGIMWSKQPRSSARKSRFVDIIMGGFWLRSMQLNYSTASPAEEIAFWILPKRILLKTEKCLNHRSMAMITIFFVFSWNPSSSIGFSVLLNLQPTFRFLGSRNVLDFVFIFHQIVSENPAKEIAFWILPKRFLLKD